MSSVVVGNSYTIWFQISVVLNFHVSSCFALKMVVSNFVNC